MKRLMLIAALMALPAWSADAPTVAKAADPARTTQELQPAVNTSAAVPVAPAPAATVGAVGGAPAGQSTAGKPRVGTPGSAGRRAQDRLDLDTLQVTGNRELPRVLYVVPWKRPDLGDLAGKPTNSLLDEVLAPVDRDVFRRQNRYYDALKPDTAHGSAGSGAGVEK